MGRPDCRPETDRYLEWPLQALLDKAPLGWAGRRGPLVSWIKLAGSLEGTKRGRERDPITLQPVAVEMSIPWCTSSGALFPLLAPSPGLLHHRVPRRALDPHAGAEENRIHSPESSTWEKADLALHPNAGAPSSEPIVNQNNTKMEESETDEEKKTEREDLCPTDSQFAASLTD